MEAKENNLHAVTFCCVQFINETVKVYRVVCLLVLQNWKHCFHQELFQCPPQSQDF